MFIGMLFFTTQNFFNIFSVDFLYGNPQKVLNGVNKAVISETNAKKNVW